ncbi:MAG: hypothetical protein Kow00129_01720 [Thermoleophilia bacterium]
MQIIVQEGSAILSLTQPIQAHDEALRSTTIREMTEDVKVFYRDYEIIRVEAREAKIEILPSALAGVFWLEKGRRYQLKVGD